MLAQSRNSLQSSFVSSDISSMAITFCEVLSKILPSLFAKFCQKYYHHFLRSFAKNDVAFSSIFCSFSVFKTLLYKTHLPHIITSLRGQA